jgi:hypothetical protein
MGCRVQEAVDLRVLAGEVDDRVEDDVDEPNVPSTLVVAMSPSVTGMSAPPGLARSCSTIAAESSIPVTGMPRAASGSANIRTK